MTNLTKLKKIDAIKYTLTKTPLCPFCNTELIRSNIYIDPMPKEPIFLCKNRCINSQSSIRDLAAIIANNDPAFAPKFRLALAYFGISQQEFADFTGYSNVYIHYLTNDDAGVKVNTDIAIHAIHLIEKMALDKTMTKILKNYNTNLGLDVQKTKLKLK